MELAWDRSVLKNNKQLKECGSGFVAQSWRLILSSHFGIIPTGHSSPERHR